jgi:GT2 family glycosyltransferase
MPTPILILNWNGWDDTFRCLASLQGTPEAEVVWLVDNGSREDRSAEAAARFPGVRVLRWEANLGYAGGNNRALRLAAQEGYEFAYLLNNDCTVQPGFLAAAEAALRDDPRRAAAGSVILHAEDPTRAEFDGDYREHGISVADLPEAPREATHLSGAGVLIRLAAMQECGFFDERFFCYCEDQEWCWRVAQGGWKLVVCPGSRVLHSRGGSNVSANALYFMTRNQFVILERHPEQEQALRRRRAIYFGLSGAAGALRAGDREAFLARAAGLRDGLAGRFGPRRAEPPSSWFLARFRLLLLGAALRDKLRAMRGLPPGV